MSHTDHKRPPRHAYAPSYYEDTTTRKQPRPPRRRTGTRHGVIRAALADQLDKNDARKPSQTVPTMR